MVSSCVLLQQPADSKIYTGEVVAGNAIGSVYIGRGRTPEDYLDNVTEAVMLDENSHSKYSIRAKGQNAFDGVAFHYTVYRFLSRFLGLDGTYSAEGDPSNVDWIDFWQDLLLTNDMINADDGKGFDPRHMYGVTNQDVFRWPTIRNGTQKQVLGYFIVALLLPGIPTLVWGEEQVSVSWLCFPKAMTYFPRHEYFRGRSRFDSITFTTDSSFTLEAPLTSNRRSMCWTVATPTTSSEGHL